MTDQIHEPAEPTSGMSFLGTGWSFPPTFDKDSASVRMVSDAEDIRQSLRILLTTTIGERLMRPTYGCDLSSYVFEPIDVGLEAYLRDLVRTAILLHEPRVFPGVVRVRASEGAESNLDGKVWIDVEYTVRATNSRQNFVYPFYKAEGTDVAT